jgi:hypothetical protein
MWLMIAVPAELERSLNFRTHPCGSEGSSAARREVGRKVRLSPEQIGPLPEADRKGEAPQYVADLLNVGRSTLYLALSATLTGLGMIRSAADHCAQATPT